jgi:23S rRNA-/tRNA-specific pseudouridylate synthase
VEILHIDDQIVVLCKPAGLGVTPERNASHDNPAAAPDTLTNRLWHYLLTLAQTTAAAAEYAPAAVAAPAPAAVATDPRAARPFIVHRLDRDVSGVIVYARTAAAHRDLSLQFERHEVVKIYLGVVAGELKPRDGVIDLPIGPLPKPNHRTRGRIFPNAPGAKAARTAYRTLGTFAPTTVDVANLPVASPAAVVAAYAAASSSTHPGASLVELTPATGRRHQLRVHMAAQGHPLIGDPLYAKKTAGSQWPEALTQAGHPPRVALHASRLEFRHPASPTGPAVRFHAPLPDDIQALVTLLRGSARGPKIDE